jgi:hypothetical protein
MSDRPSLLPASYPASLERHGAQLQIQWRIQRRYGKLKSFSPAMRRYFADADIRKALLAAGLPVPQVHVDHIEQRARIYRELHGPNWLTRVHPRFREAWLSHLAAGGGQ